MDKKYYLSLVDQFFVSSGNFLLITLCANFFDLYEQGKLAYIFSSYILTVILNISIFFYAIPIVKSRSSDNKKYRTVLRWAQIFTSIFISALIVGIFNSFNEYFVWDISFEESSYIFIYLFIQQIVDFHRREGYVLTSLRDSIMSSASSNLIRIGLIILVKPNEISEVLVLLIISCIPSALIFFKGLNKINKLTIFSAKEKISDHLKIIKISTINAPLGWALFYLPVFIIGFVYSPKFSAVVISLRSLLGFINVLLEILETYIPEKLSEIFSKYGKKSLNKLSMIIALIGTLVWLVIFLVLYFFSDDIVFHILGESYLEYSNILIIFWAGYLIHFFSRVIGLKWRVQKAPITELIATLGGFIVLLISIPLIIYYGIFGLALVYLLVPFGMILSKFTYINFNKKI